MPLTRKQAWRRVRVRHEVGETKDEFSARCKRPATSDMVPETRKHQQQYKAPERSAVHRERVGTTSPIRSPDRKALESWRLPKEGREPSARPGVSASRRQAAAPCVRVGSRVSFNTVVAAILIPSAKDLNAAARRELWWQETDYRDFRINFIQFMRTPPAVPDVPEMVPVDIVAECTSGASSAEEKQQELPSDDSQPVIVGAVMLEDTPCDAPSASAATESVRAWPVEEEPADLSSLASGNTGCENVIESERAVRAAACASASPPTPTVAAAATALSEDETPETPTGEAIGGDTFSVAAGGTSSRAVPSFTAQAPPAPPPVSSDAANDYIVGDRCDGAGDGAAAATSTADLGGSWDEQEWNRRVDACDDDNPASTDAPGDEEGDAARVRRSFSNLETARRDGAGRDSEIMSEDITSDSDEADADEGIVLPQNRPRALSLDGWFTCGLENGVDWKSYDNHNHAGRLRNLVKLTPFPTVCATPPQTNVNRQEDLSEALRRLRVTFNVSVKGDNATGKSEGGRSNSKNSVDGDGSSTNRGETKCRAEEDHAAQTFPGVVSSAASRKTSDLGGAASGRNGMATDINVYIS